MFGLIFGAKSNKLNGMQIIKGYSNKRAWNNFIKANSSPASFLQSWEWGEFNKEYLANPVKKIAVEDRSELKIIFNLIQKKLPFQKNYIYLPKGPIWDKNYSSERFNVYAKLLRQAKDEFEGAVFIRVNSPYEDRGYTKDFLKRLNFKRPRLLVHSEEPKKTILLNLKKTEQDILQEMHKKTRYNIRLAVKKGVVAKMVNNDLDKYIKIFSNLNHQTAKRNKISIYTDRYYTQLLKLFSFNKADLKTKLHIAWYNHTPLAAAIVVYFGNAATYLHGASSSEMKNLMAPYLLHWHIIRHAKKQGYKFYDLWGIDEDKPSWAGITKFKKGFGGEPKIYLGSWDYILDNKWYSLFSIAKTGKEIIKLFK